MGGTASCSSNENESVDVFEARSRRVGGNLPERSAHGSGTESHRSHHRTFWRFAGCGGRVKIK